MSSVDKNGANTTAWLQTFSSTEQQQIAAALGFTSAAEVPAAKAITQEMLSVIEDKLPKDLSKRVTTAIGLANVLDPKLDKSTMTKAQFAERALLIMVLLSNFEDTQATSALARLKSRSDSMQQKTNERMEKLKESADKLKAAEITGIVMKALSWAAVALSLIVSAVVVVASVAVAIASGGTATALVGVACAVAGAVIALAGAAVMVLEETGAMDAALNAICGTNEAAKTAIRIGIQVALVAATIATIGVGIIAALPNILTAGAQVVAKGIDATAKAATVAAKAAALLTMAKALVGVIITGGSSVAKTATGALKALEKTMDLISKAGAALQAIGTGAQAVGSGVQAGLQFDASMTRAALKEDEAMLALMQQLMDLLLEAYQKMIGTCEEAKNKIGDAVQGYQTATMSILGSAGA